MGDAIAVLNTGSSSIKFSLFGQRNGDLLLAIRGQAEGLYTAPRFVAKDAGGQSMASTMGFTSADGLPMGTRCGNRDPGVMLCLMDELKMDARHTRHVLNGG